jgi:hypothetical protein
MHWPRPSVVQLAVLVMLAATIRPWVQAPNAQSPQEAPPLPYRPGLGDLMTMTVQPRHIKLGLAGDQRTDDGTRPGHQGVGAPSSPPLTRG